MIEIQENKEDVIRNIVMELSIVPDEYLQTLYAIIHSFRTHLPDEHFAAIEKNKKIEMQKENSENFDWNDLLSDIFENRRNNNLNMNKRIDKLMW